MTLAGRSGYRDIGVTSVLLLMLTGCVQVDFQSSLSTTNESAASFTGGNLQLNQTSEQRQASRSRADALLQEPLSQVAAVEVVLTNSPSVQQLLANHWASASSIAVSGGIPNPVFEFSRLSSDSELEIERILAIGLLDLIRLPQRQQQARLRLQAGQIQMTADVIDLVTSVRQSWINAVVAQEYSNYAEQVLKSAEASAELAARMQAIGNFNALSRARQQAFYSDAATGLALARHNALAAKENLVRTLGLDDSQSGELKLPERLPDIPEEPISSATVTEIATESRIDVSIALSNLKAVTAQQGLQLLGEIIDIEIEAERNTVWSEGERESISGYAVGVEIPIFSRIDQVRNKLNANSLAAASALEQATRAANSHLRESYSAYRTSFDVAKHYRDEVVPLQQLVSEENVLNYNGMIIGIFELLADSRKQIQTVQASINATGQFWLADAALRASMIGKPTSTMIAMSSGAESGGDGEDH